MNDVSLKAKIRNLAREKQISSQAVLQNYLMQRFLYRLSLSDYKDKFVIKGGMLIASMVGIAHRATMDLDTTLKNLPLTEPAIKESFENICSVPLDDGIAFSLGSIDPIRKDDRYGGYKVGYFAKFGKINAPMSMDISTGDVITPEAQKHTFCDMFDETIRFELWSYPIETILAEKIETILSRGIDNTRPRDYYDVYMLSGFDYDAAVFSQALQSTARHRGSLNNIGCYEEIIENISKNPEMNNRWKQYSKQTPYAANIYFQDTLSAVDQIMSGFMDS